jgi:hypothetical protein
LTKLLFTKVYNSENTYLSIIERKNSIFSIVVKRIYIFFTRFRAARLNNDRYVISRYYLIRLTQKLGIYNKFNYCFSHSGRYSAVIFSSEIEHISVDIEPLGRRIPESLRLEIRSLYPDLKIAELMVILILESLVKLSIFKPPVNFLKGLADMESVKINELKNSVFEINVNNVKVYSKIYTFLDLYICITLESSQFDLTL